MDRNIYQQYKLVSVGGRYLPPVELERALSEMLGATGFGLAGTSVKSAPVYRLDWGKGPIKVLLWSQMHGNESTTTKALLDLLQYLRGDDPGAAALHQALQLKIFPQLNPDGSVAYTRENANGVDLNRDARKRTQPESRILREAYEGFQPHFCFNLHDQRTIYNVAHTDTPATLSFLAPAMDSARSIPPHREAAMGLIAGIVNALAADLPGGIGRYDDSFNPDCVGDQFQMGGTPTLLFEAGHYPGDYQREHTRYLVWKSLLTALRLIASRAKEPFPIEAYHQIPENAKQMVDLQVRNAHQIHPKYPEGTPVSIQYRESLVGSNLQWIPEFPEPGLTEGLYPHETLDAATPDGLQELQSRPGLWALLTNP